MKRVSKNSSSLLLLLSLGINLFTLVHLSQKNTALVQELQQQKAELATIYQVQTTVADVQDRQREITLQFQGVQAGINALANAGKSASVLGVANNGSSSVTPAGNTASNSFSVGSAVNPKSTKVAPTPSPLGMLQVVNVGQGEYSSIVDDGIKKNVLEKVAAGTVLFFFQRKDGWYQVERSANTGELGWILESNVTELPR